MVSLMLASHYENIPLVYIRGMIPWNWTRQFGLINELVDQKVHISGKLKDNFLRNFFKTQSKHN